MKRLLKNIVAFLSFINWSVNQHAHIKKAMKKNLIWSFIVLLLIVSMYEVIFRTRTVTYMGEDMNWFIEINSKLVGLNGSYRIKVRYKGKEHIQDVDFKINPYYELRFSSFNKNNYYYWDCKDDCGYYDKNSKLRLFIFWVGNNSEEKMAIIDLKKIIK
ncbi:MULTISPECIES: hypothetical protein [unclassified Bacillus (in: firmicutes)]|uniref:hypothetical protein n=1 Tax=unclassified Bacillus (in: firmicutes) TaxID=185979 RepID=UPI0008EA2A45|nr:MULTISPECIES: hypothetical protein [unclassified Bacillus (in: firmicutes)]SFA89766.1 hypothetical protein SAMN02799634_102426 [Bacillus sp. UNCCL13]SFQ85022.1 hypothetical protein SAMN04488577_2545 [Bacillus sp. cl95]